MPSMTPAFMISFFINISGTPIHSCFIFIYFCRFRQPFFYGLVHGLPLILRVTKWADIEKTPPVFSNPTDFTLTAFWNL